MVTAPTAVYRFYDADDRLLYVGITDSLGTRWSRHSLRDWWSDVQRYTLSWHDTRRAAEAEEAAAITSESPIHNVAGVAAPDPDAMTLNEFNALPDYVPPPRRTRRTKGDGGLYQRADGMWVSTVDLGYTDDGRRRRKAFYSKDREQAAAAAAEYRATA